MDEDADRDPYGVSDLDDDRYYAVGIESEKTQKLRKSEPDKPMDDYTYFYTNLDPREVPPEELAADYRRRWGIETGFRVIKNNFLAKSASRDPAIRAFYFNFAAHLYNIWTVANILRAEELGEELDGEKYITAGRLIQAIEDDPHDLQIPTEPPVSRQVFGDLFEAEWATTDADQLLLGRLLNGAGCHTTSPRANASSLIDVPVDQHPSLPSH